MAKKPFVGITKINRNGKQHFAEIVLQADFEDFSGLRAPFISIELPIRSINLTADEQVGIEQAVRNAVDWDAIAALAEKAR